MDLNFTEADEAFRGDLREWLRTNLPTNKPEGDMDAHMEWLRSWQRTLYEAGWLGIEWPVEWGGRGGSLAQSAILYEELGRAEAPLPPNVLGLFLAGPTLISLGTQEQKERYLQPILSGEEIWCQGFSEPEAGSDLAALKTRAVRDGDEWVIDGQKVWTSVAQYSKWCMLVARTDRDAPRKHQGLTYFLLDMEQDGVTASPLRQITGEAEFNEVFLDGARVPDENVVGGVGNGWKVALTTLMNERAGLAFFNQARVGQLVKRLIREATANGAIENPAVAGRLGELHQRSETIRLFCWKGLSGIERHGQPGPEGSLTKWLWSETTQLLAETAVEVVGADALASGSAGSWGFELLRSRGTSIEGGTTEILKNIVAERVLGLPRGR